MKFVSTDFSRDPDEELVFSFKGLFTTLWREIFTLFKANVFFLLFSIPIITFPCALTALFSVCIDAIRGKKSEVFKTYLNTIKSQFFISWLMLVLVAVSEFVSFYGAYSYFQRVAEHKILLIPGLILSVAATMIVIAIPYLYCLLSKVDLRFKDVIKDAFLVAVLNLKFSICSTVLAVVFLASLFLFWLYMIPLMLTIAFALCAYVSSYFSLYGIQKYILTEKL